MSSFGFRHTRDGIFVRSTALADLADGRRTPFYVYDMTGIQETASDIKRLTGGGGARGLFACYAVKANAANPICETIIREGLGFDVVSGGEMSHVLALGARPEDIYFSGAGKTIEEIDDAIGRGIAGIHVESIAEIAMIEARARHFQKTVAVGLRWNPDSYVDTHPSLRTGTDGDKFGLTEAQLDTALNLIRASAHLSLNGLHVHIGSQILDIGIFSRLFALVKKRAEQLLQDGYTLSHVDVGGGLGIYYDAARIHESAVVLERYFETLAAAFDGAPYRVITELGRAIVGIHGALAARVLYAKEAPSKNFLIFDASMTELLRPALYKARHPVWIQYQSTEPHDRVYELTSPICESGDVFDERFACPFKPTYGDLALVLCAGAYGYSMASRYNLRPLPEEVFV